MAIRLTKAVKALLILCFVAFVVQQTGDRYGANFLGWLGLVPYGFVVEHRFWQIVTFAFLHGDVMHLFLNMMMLVFIGGELEATWGTARFLRFYFLCSVSAGLLYLILQLVFWGDAGLQTPMVGASGAIYGLLMAYGLLFGERVLLFMMLFPMKAKHFVWILAAMEFMTTVYAGRGGLASAAHLGGMATGFLYLWGRAAWVVFHKRHAEGRKLSRREKKRKAAEHLRLVINNDEKDKSAEDPKVWH